MLTSITPLGERARGRKWSHTVAAYIAGSILGGGLVGSVVGGAGALWPESIRPSSTGVALIVAVTLALVVASELRLITVPLFPAQRQVNENWLAEFRGWVVGLGFGLQLGAGLTTVVTTAAIPATFLLALLTFSFGNGLLIGLAFGAARAVPIFATRRVGTTERLAALHKQYDSTARPARWGAAVLAAAMGLMALLAI